MMFSYQWFPNQSGGHGFGTAPEERAGPGGPRRHGWGRGYVLGSD